MRRPYPHMPMRKYIGTSVLPRTRRRGRGRATRRRRASRSRGRSKDEVDLDLVGDRPRRQDRQRHEERRQQHHPQAHAVDAGDVVDAPLRDPFEARAELEVVRGRVEVEQDHQREGERDQCTASAATDSDPFVCGLRRDASRAPGRGRKITRMMEVAHSRSPTQGRDDRDDAEEEDGFVRPDVAGLDPPPPVGEPRHHAHRPR